MRKRTRTLLGALAVAAAVSLVPTARAAADTYWQCVPFARLVSGIQIFGDARTWWKQAIGRYETGGQPKPNGIPTGEIEATIALNSVPGGSPLRTELVGNERANSGECPKRQAKKRLVDDGEARKERGAARGGMKYQDDANGNGAHKRTGDQLPAKADGLRRCDLHGWQGVFREA